MMTLRSLDSGMRPARVRAGVAAVIDELDVIARVAGHSCILTAAKAEAAEAAHLRTPIFSPHGAIFGRWFAARLPG